jgi:hypothetical protein
MKHEPTQAETIAAIAAAVKALINSKTSTAHSGAH